MTIRFFIKNFINLQKMVNFSCKNYIIRLSYIYITGNKIIQMEGSDNFVKRTDNMLDRISDDGRYDRFCSNSKHRHCHWRN